MEIKISTKEEFNKLYKHIALYKKEKASSVTIDISNLKFLEPDHIIILVQFIIYSVSIGSGIDIIRPKDAKVAKYLEQIGLLEFCKSNHKESKTIDFINSQTAMPIRRISTESLTEYIDSAVKYFGKFCAGKDLIDFFAFRAHSMLSLSLKGWAPCFNKKAFTVVEIPKPRSPTTTITCLLSG